MSIRSARMSPKLAQSTRETPSLPCGEHRLAAAVLRFGDPADVDQRHEAVVEVTDGVESRVVAG